jgi:hypothetical protein
MWRKAWSQRDSDKLAAVPGLVDEPAATLLLKWLSPESRPPTFSASFIMAEALLTQARLVADFGSSCPQKEQERWQRSVSRWALLLQTGCPYLEGTRERFVILLNIQSRCMRARQGLGEQQVGVLRGERVGQACQQRSRSFASDQSSHTGGAACNHDVASCCNDILVEVQHVFVWRERLALPGSCIGVALHNGEHAVWEEQRQTYHNVGIKDIVQGSNLLKGIVPSKPGLQTEGADDAEYLLELWRVQ